MTDVLVAHSSHVSICMQVMSLLLFLSFLLLWILPIFSRSSPLCIVHNPSNCCVVLFVHGQVPPEVDDTVNRRQRWICRPDQHTPTYVDTAHRQCALISTNWIWLGDIRYGNSAACLMNSTQPRFGYSFSSKRKRSGLRHCWWQLSS